MAISLKTAGTWARVVTDPSSVTIPGSPASGDRMFLFANWKTFDVTVADPSGWTPITNSFADGTTAAGNGTGSVSVAAWYRDWVTGDGNPSLNWSAAPTEAHAVVMLWQKAGGDTWAAPDFATAAIPANDPFTATATQALTIVDGAVVMCMIALRDDSTTIARGVDDIDDDGTPTVTWNGNYVESPATHFNSTTGLDMAGDLGHRFVTTGAAGVSLVVAADPAAAETGSALFVHQALLVAVTGTGAGTGAASTASGTAAETFTGTGAGTGTASTASGTGEETFTGTGAGTGTASSASGTGEVTAGAVEGTGAGTQVVATATGDGVETFTGTGAGTQPASTGSGSAAETFTGTGAGAGAASTASGTGTETFTGTGAGVQAPASGAGSDLQPVTGTGAGTGQAATSDGSGLVGSATPVQAGFTVTDFPRIDLTRKLYGRGKGVGARPSGKGVGRVSTDELDFAALLEQIGDAA